jgi:glycosyltransferase involved in cell wall biosynthesis
MLMASGFVQRGHEVTVMVGRAPTWLKPDDITLQRWPDAPRKRPINPVPFATWAHHEIDAGGFDASISLSTRVPASIVYARKGTFREFIDRCRVLESVISANGMNGATSADKRRRNQWLKLERQCVNDPRVQHWVAPSPYVCEQLNDHYGLTDQVKTIADRIALSNVDLAQRRHWRDHTRQALGIAPDETVYLFLAHHPLLGGVETLLRAIIALEQRDVRPGGNDFSVMLAGWIDFPLAEHIAQLGLRKRIRIIGRSNQREQLCATADALVIPAYFDPFSITVTEAQLAAVPTITSRYDGASAIAGKAPNLSVLDDPADSDALAASMATAVESTSPTPATLAARALAELLDPDQTIKEFEKLLKSLSLRERVAAPKRSEEADR